jgi:hypothetical protein
MQHHILSKSTFMRGMQCAKRLYLNKHFPALRDETSARQQAIFTQGTDVGKLAQTMFPGGVDASPPTPFEYDKSMALTQQAIANGVEAIYEAAFLFDEVLVLTDILVNDDGEWSAYEVKSSTELKDEHIWDASIQYYVISHAGIELSDFSVVYINNKYIRKGNLDVHSLFSIQSVFAEVQQNEDAVRDKIREFKRVLKQGTTPTVDIGTQCSTPYECDFKGYCWKHIPDNSVFHVSGLRTEKKFELYRSGIISMVDIPDDYPLKSDERLQVDCYKNNCPFIDRKGIADFLKTLTYPLYFVDFETYNPAVPIYDNSRPYQRIEFQYSLYYRHDKRTELEHSEFLADAGKDPRGDFIVHFLKDTEKPGDILVYNRGFEESCLRELAKDFAQHKTDIDQRISRIKDLMEPFRRKLYYEPEMQGSFSIKSVVPVLAPELTYDTLEVQDGQMAMDAFVRLQNETDLMKLAELRQQLLDYCRMDTLAMVRILEELEKL